MIVTIDAISLDDPDAVLLVKALDADLTERYAGDGDAAGEPDHAMLNILGPDVAPPRGTFLVGRLDGEPVACGAIRRHDTTTAELKRMYVAPPARGRGIARRLLAELEGAARDLGYDRLILETGTRQPEAMALYESSGWTPIENYGAYRSSPLSRCFEKSL